ncbi:DUF2479 domain-containing protein [Periweissella cryptocerci]|uniref:DUF2479 domain-containing protein n=1 Tax=Periweissella cryptocerci TaxID=2506420 RepID=A0A4P6YRV7_9LACO|nr:BppU family phage baseplate upper protein [Periweissella cryptocerci]QBO35371.1 DUF2479 domain-containing protein [Periweissella cryptocerci]
MTQTLTIDLDKRNVTSDRVLVRQDETGNKVAVNIVEGGKAYSLEGKTVSFKGNDANGQLQLGTAVVSDDGTQAIYTFTAENVAVIGTYGLAYFYIVDADGETITSGTFKLKVLPQSELNPTQATFYVSKLDELITAFETAIANGAQVPQAPTIDLTETLAGYAPISYVNEAVAGLVDAEYMNIAIDSAIDLAVDSVNESVDEKLTAKADSEDVFTKDEIYVLLENTADNLSEDFLEMTGNIETALAAILEA